ncbi:MAG: hypothetical protein CVT95_11285, partial [Bacteroidetes bacterium HGW-Bacteroidetes-12]
MLNNNTYKIIELVILFILIPISLAFPIIITLKISLVLLAAAYCLWVSVKLNLVSKKELYYIQQH